MGLAYWLGRQAHLTVNSVGVGAGKAVDGLGQAGRDMKQGWVDVHSASYFAPSTGPVQLAAGQRASMTNEPAPAGKAGYHSTIEIRNADGSLDTTKTAAARRFVEDHNNAEAEREVAAADELVRFRGMKIPA